MTGDLLTTARQEWVVPFYLKLLHGNFKGVCSAENPEPHLVEFSQRFREAYRDISPSIINLLLEQPEWRGRLVASWFVGLKGWKQYREEMGRLLLQSSLCYAGQGHAAALACFADHESAELLSVYLEEYLPQTEKFYDQHWAMPALMWVDRCLDSSYSSRFLRPRGLWSLWESASSGRSLEKYEEQFWRTLQCASRISGAQLREIKGPG